MNDLGTAIARQYWPDHQAGQLRAPAHVLDGLPSAATFRDNWSMRQGQVGPTGTRSSWTWSDRWGFPSWQPMLSGLDGLDGPPAIAAGVAAIISAAVAGGTGIASTIAAIARQNKKDRDAEIQAAIARGDPPETMKDIRKRYRRKLREDKQAARAARKGKPRRRRGGKARRKTSMTDDQRATQTLHAAASGARTAADVLQRVGMGVQEAATGSTIDPMTGQPIVHHVVPTAPPPSGGIRDLAMRPSLGGLPMWAVAGGGLVALLAVSRMLGGRR